MVKLTWWPRPGSEASWEGFPRGKWRVWGAGEGRQEELGDGNSVTLCTPSPLVLHTLPSAHPPFHTGCCSWQFPRVLCAPGAQ